MSDRSRVVVVGGGVIGASCAYYLAKAGWAVTVVDRSQFSRACSAGNCGYVCPSHVLPLAGPGVLGSTFKALLTPNGPLRIKWRWNPGLWKWFFQFSRLCNKHAQIANGHAIRPLLDSSRALFETLLKVEQMQCEWDATGLLFVFRTPAAMNHYAEVDHLLAEEFGRPARRLEGPELTDFEPALKPGLAGGWLNEGDAQLRPDRLMAEWRRVLESLGVEIRETCALQSFHAEAGRVCVARTEQGEIEAEHYVIATGAWTPLLHQALGCRLPIQPGKGYSLTMPRPRICPRVPMIFEEDRVAVTAWPSGYRIGSTMEFAGYDTSLPPRRLELLRRAAREYLQEPECEPVLEQWYGWRPMTPDSLPFIGPTPAYKNVWLAAGHNMLGLSMAPATGKLISELISGTHPHIDPGPYALPGRF